MTLICISGGKNEQSSVFSTNYSLVKMLALSQICLLTALSPVKSPLSHIEDCIVKNYDGSVFSLISSP